MARLTRIADPDLAMIWRHKHRDYRGDIDGRRTIVTHDFESGGSCLVFLDAMTPQQLAFEIEPARQCEAKRLQAKQRAQSGEMHP